MPSTWRKRTPLLEGKAAPWPSVDAALDCRPTRQTPPPPSALSPPPRLLLCRHGRVFVVSYNSTVARVASAAAAQRPARTLTSARAARACAARARGGVLRRCGQHGPPTPPRSSQRRARGREQGAAPLGRASYRYHLHHLSPTGCAPSRYHQVTIVSARSAESTSKLVLLPPLALLPPPPPQARPWCLPRPRGPGGGADKGASAGARTRWRCARCRCTRRGTRAR